MITSRKIRIYPDDNQLQIINNTFNVCRFIWNQMLELSIKSYDDGQLIIPNYGDIVLQNSWLSKDNEEYRFDRHSVNNVKQFLRQSFNKYFDNIKKGNIKMRKDGRPRSFPRFKSKKYCKNSYSNYHGEHVHIDNENHQIKIPCLGWIKYIMSKILRKGKDDLYLIHILARIRHRVIAYCLESLDFLGKNKSSADVK